MAEGFFFPNADPNVDATMRQRIALAMLARKRTMPKNLGEGIASIGQEIGDALAARGMLAENAAENKRADEFRGQFTGTPQAEAPPETTPPPVALAAAPPTPPIVPVPPPQARTITPAPIPPPDGTPGNTGATTFPPPFQPPPGPLQPPPGLPPVSPAAAPVVAQGDEDPRRAIGLAMLRQQTGGAPPSPPRPSVADFGQTRALAPTPPQEISAAPPAAPLRAAPPPQVAQASPLVPPLGPEVSPPPVMTPLQQRILQKIEQEPPATREAARKAVQPLLDQEQAKLTQAHEVWKERQTARRAMEIEQYRLTGGAPKTAAEIEKIQQETLEAKNKNQLRTQFANMDPDTVFKTMSESSKVASSAVKSLAASQSAIEALNAGAITGAGAEARLDIAKFFHNMGLPDKGNLIANTETFRGAMQPVVASIMHQTSGTSQLSEGELKFAARAAAGDITLDAQSVRMLTTIIDKASRGVIADHQKKMDVLFPDNPQAKALFGVEMPKLSGSSAGTPDGTTATGPNGAKMIRRNGRWEPM